MTDETATSAFAAAAGRGGEPWGRLRPAPRWVAPVFAAVAAGTVPWVIYLASSLPRTVRLHDRTAWVGFDILLILMLGTTAYLAWRGRPRVALAATATATMLVVDTWFDLLTSHGMELAVAFGTAVMQLALAGLCLWIALHAGTVIRHRIAALAGRHPGRPGTPDEP